MIFLILSSILVLFGPDLSLFKCKAAYYVDMV